MNNDNRYHSYKTMRGEMTRDQFQRFVDHIPSRVELERSEACLYAAYAFNELGEPSEESIEIGARLVGAMGNDIPKDVDGFSPHRNWVMMESSILAKVLVLEKKT